MTPLTIILVDSRIFQPMNGSSPARLFQGRKWLSYNGLIVVEKAASQWNQSHREDRQDGDHTHYKTPATQNYARLRSTFPVPIGDEITTVKKMTSGTKARLGPNCNAYGPYGLIIGEAVIRNWRRQS